MDHTKWKGMKNGAGKWHRIVLKVTFALWWCASLRTFDSIRNSTRNRSDFLDVRVCVFELGSDLRGPGWHRFDLRFFLFKFLQGVGWIRTAGIIWLRGRICQIIPIGWNCRGWCHQRSWRRFGLIQVYNRISWHPSLVTNSMSSLGFLQSRRIGGVRKSLGGTKEYNALPSYWDSTPSWQINDKSKQKNFSQWPNLVSQELSMLWIDPSLQPAVGLTILGSCFLQQMPRD